MAQLFDNICRTLATPMPRSRALKLILGGLAGAALAPFGFGQQQQCPPTVIPARASARAPSRAAVPLANNAALAPAGTSAVRVPTHAAAISAVSRHWRGR